MIYNFLDITIYWLTTHPNKKRTKWSESTTIRQTRDSTQPIALGKLRDSMFTHLMRMTKISLPIWFSTVREIQRPA